MDSLAHVSVHAVGKVNRVFLGVHAHLCVRARACVCACACERERGAPLKIFFVTVFPEPSALILYPQSTNAAPNPSIILINTDKQSITK